MVYVDTIRKDSSLQLARQRLRFKSLLQFTFVTCAMPRLLQMSWYETMFLSTTLLFIEYYKTKNMFKYISKVTDLLNLQLKYIRLYKLDRTAVVLKMLN